MYVGAEQVLKFHTVSGKLIKQMSLGGIGVSQSGAPINGLVATCVYQTIPDYIVSVTRAITKSQGRARDVPGTSLESSSPKHCESGLGSSPSHSVRP